MWPKHEAGATGQLLPRALHSHLPGVGSTCTPSPKIPAPKFPYPALSQPRCSGSLLPAPFSPSQPPNPVNGSVILRLCPPAPAPALPVPAVTLPCPSLCCGGKLGSCWFVAQKVAEIRHFPSSPCSIQHGLCKAWARLSRQRWGTAEVQGNQK